MSEIELAPEVPQTSAIPDAPANEEIQTQAESAAQPELNETPDDAGEPSEKKPHWATKRIDELTRNWREEQRRVDALTQALLQQRGQPPQPEAPKPAQPTKLPTLEEFGYDEAKYQAALIEYADRKAEQTVEKRFAEYERQRAEQARAESFLSRATEFAKTNPDFMDVLRAPTLPISEAVQELAKDLENGPELIHWLYQNRHEAERLMRLPERLQAFEAGRIADRLETQKAQKATAPAKPVVTKAPPPPPTVETADVPMEKSQEDMSADEWMRWREKQLSRKRKT